MFADRFLVIGSADKSFTQLMPLKTSNQPFAELFAVYISQQHKACKACVYQVMASSPTSKLEMSPQFVINLSVRNIWADLHEQKVYFPGTSVVSTGS